MTDIRDYSARRDFENVIASCKAEGWTAFFTDKKAAFAEALSGSVTLTAFTDGVYCGFIRCITDGCFTVYCCELLVDRRYRGKGIGRQLIRAVSERYPGLCIDVLSDSDAFYKSCGFDCMGSGMRKA